MISRRPLPRSFRGQAHQVEEEFCRFPSAIAYLERLVAIVGQQDRKLLLRLYRLREHQKEAALLPINQEQLAQLGRFIASALRSRPCDHTLQNAALWANQNDVDPESLLRGLETRGGYCDCEVLFNVVR